MFLEFIDGLLEGEKYDAFSELLVVSREVEMIEEHFPSFLDTIDNYFDEYKYYAFTSLIDSIESTELLNKYYPQIETKFLVFLEVIDRLPADLHRYCAFYELMDSIKKTDVLNKCSSQIETQFLSLMNDIDELPNHHKIVAFSDLISVARITGLRKEHVSVFFEAIDKIPDGDKYLPFIKLLELSKITGLIKEFFLKFLETIETFVGYDKYHGFSDLFKIAKEKGWIVETFPAFLEAIDKLRDEDKYPAFSKLFNAIRATELMNEYSNGIETIFLALLKQIDFDNKLSDKYSRFSMLIEMAEEMRFTKKYLPVLLEIFPKLPDIDELGYYYKQDAYSNLIKTIKGTDLENESAFKKWKEKNQIL
jgi:hypothetical protein